MFSIMNLLTFIYAAFTLVALHVASHNLLRVFKMHLDINWNVQESVFNFYRYILSLNLILLLEDSRYNLMSYNFFRVYCVQMYPYDISLAFYKPTRYSFCGLLKSLIIRCFHIFRWKGIRAKSIYPVLELEKRKNLMRLFIHSGSGDKKKEKSQR